MTSRGFLPSGISSIATTANHSRSSKSKMLYNYYFVFQNETAPKSLHPGIQYRVPNLSEVATTEVVA